MPERLKRGWKRDPQTGQPVSPEQWRDRYVLRAVAFPVVGPVGKSWAEFREALRAVWSATTALSNWMMTEMYARDVRRAPGMQKLPPQPKTYLYPEAREKFPDLPSGTVAAIEHAVRGKYRATRYKLLWTNEISLPNHRYPAPFAAPNQVWKAKFDENNRPLVELPLAGERWTLRLRGGRSYGRQLAAFRQIVDGAAVQGELALYRQRASSSDHRSGVQDRDSGGQRQLYRVMCKLVAWLPRGPQVTGSGTLWVRTDKDSLLVALNAKGKRVWVLHADHIRRWQAEHSRRLHRWSHDQNAEQRPVAKFQSRREAAVQKYRRRLNTACHEAAAQLTDYAARRRFATIKYDDSEQSFCGRFPWFKLRELIHEKLDAKGIAFEHPSGPAPQ